MTFLRSSTDIIFLIYFKCFLPHSTQPCFNNLQHEVCISFRSPAALPESPMVECYVTIESCSHHIRVSIQCKNECVHCVVMLFLVLHQFNYSPHIFPTNLAFLSRGFNHPLFYFSPIRSVMFYPHGKTKFWKSASFIFSCISTLINFRDAVGSKIPRCFLLLKK